ncbi:MAG: antibiotic biosynthesis monooxygenase [Paracoccus sp. (in: a-proteobacteria)]|nr:antibiotic biosynthesis monooxygenase [Paracoccus sp. (in: a-proteobacteria)]
MSCTCGQDHGPAGQFSRIAPEPGQVAISIRLTCTDLNQLQILLDHLPEHVALSRAEPGCLLFTATQTQDPLIWQVEELYTDLAALEAHKARMNATIWPQVSQSIERTRRQIGP